ncbi:M48 family metalloprotease [Actibacterium lipolyticum]|uniref:TPR repeat-containing protein YfgC n=1 Tax=Actibacterium lipolyticum TaxID=1524263 RepID=A0A238KIZ9_9RHOB|nr:M48 family metalloprotease [Actibacterium lipolyticum]SMX42785.1 TPR repeat-containing protein YfgC precursor [Actibacterium lipolyticum]
MAARSGIIAVLLSFIIAVASPARAQGLIRDAEIEYALRQLAAPLAAAAGMNASRLQVLVINDSSLNAFVIDGRTVFIHSGLLLKFENAAQAQAVLSHEMAHIANGHITRRLANLRGARSAAAMGLLMSVAIAASGNAQAAAGVAAGTSSSAQRLFLAHTRAEESSADQAGVRYMARAGIDPHAMVDVLNIFKGQEALSASRQDPYVLTHPLNRDRLRAMTGFAAAYGGKAKDNPTADYWFARAQGKLGAFLQNPSYTLRRVKASDNSDAAIMRRAIAHHRKPDAKAALQEIDKLVAKRPKDPYVRELRGQILLESRNFAAAVNAYGRAVNLAPNEPLILAGYGRALLALNTSDGNKKALAALERARSRDPYDPRMLRDLAVVYARGGNNGMASVATAERYAVQGRLSDAAVHAKRATGLLKQGTPGWLRAQDVLAAAQTAKKNR